MLTNVRIVLLQLFNDPQLQEENRYMAHSQLVLYATNVLPSETLYNLEDVVFDIHKRCHGVV